MQVRARFV